MNFKMKPVQIMSHPLVACHLAILRDKQTPPSEFRRSVDRLSTLLAYAATENLRTNEIEIQTPMGTAIGGRLVDRIGLVPILRAGIAMVDAMLNLIPTSEVWHLGLYRDEETAKPVGYYNKLPSLPTVDFAFVLDPMLATGGSACMACEALTEWGVTQIKMLSIISAPEGIQRLQSQFPNVTIHTCAVDKCLNHQKFIVPGLGDAGDRIFNTLVNG
jgi:uracil phosphoribosyltransferase